MVSGWPQITRGHFNALKSPHITRSSQVLKSSPASWIFNTFQAFILFEICFPTGQVFLPTYEVPVLLLAGSVCGELDSVCPVLVLHRAVSWARLQKFNSEYFISPTPTHLICPIFSTQDGIVFVFQHFHCFSVWQIQKRSHWRHGLQQPVWERHSLSGEVLHCQAQQPGQSLWKSNTPL